jgi:hypothetical protein
MANLSNINNKFLVTTGGNVLIGQTAALSGSDVLQVTGNSTFSGSVTTDKIIIDGASNSNVSQFALTRTDYSWGIFNETNLRFYVQSGNTTTPNGQVLEIATNGNATFTGNITLNPGNSNKIILTPDVNSHYITGNAYWVDVVGNAAEVFRVFGGVGGTSEYFRITGTGAISVGNTGTNYGTSGEVLISNGNTSPTWGAATSVSEDNYYKIDDGLNFYLAFKEGSGTTVADVSGGRNNFTAGLGLDWSETGRFGYAQSFNGSNSYLSGTGPSSTKTTFSAWVNNDGDGGIQNIVSGTYIMAYVSIYNNNFSIYDGVGWRNGGAVPANEWVHVAFSYDAAGTSGGLQKMYVNGVLGYSATAVGYTGVASYISKVGIFTGAIRYFNGEITAIKTWDRILSDSEILAIYNQTALNENLTVLGKVGIGTTSISERLTVDGNAEILKGDDARVYIKDVGDSSTILLRSDGANTSIGTDSNHDLQIHANGSEKMRVHTGGSITMGEFNSTNAPNNGILKIKTGGSTAGTCYPLLSIMGSTHLATRQYGIGMDPEGYSNRVKMFFGVDGMGNGYSFGDFVWNINTQVGNNIVSPTDERMRLDKGGDLKLKTGSLLISNTSQGVYLGGTAVAHKLDFYKTDTWAPQIYYQNATDQANATNSTQTGIYTKIGNVCTVQFRLIWTQASGTPAVDNIGIKNLPFGGNTTQAYAEVPCSLIGYTGGPSPRGDLTLTLPVANQTLAIFNDTNNIGNMGNAIGSGTKEIRFSFTYLTN